VPGNGGNVSHIRLDGVELKNASESGLFLGADNSMGFFSEIINCKIHDIGTNNFHHGIYVTASNVLIDGCEIYAVTGSGIVNYSQGATPQNNIFRRNYIHGTGTYTASIAMAIGLYTAGNNQVYNNIVANNQEGIDITTNNNLVYNNTVYGNGVGFGGKCCFPTIKNNLGSGNVIKNNIVFGNQVNSIDTNGSSGTVVSNNLSSNPFFVDAGNNRFDLQAGSPAIDAGTSSITSGITVPFNGSAPDIGAIEY